MTSLTAPRVIGLLRRHTAMPSLSGRSTLYRIPILLTAAGPEDVPARILKDLGHVLGLSEARLRELGWY
jgi:hypothetical protein